MTSYRFSISPKERIVGRFLGKVRRELQKAFAEERGRGLSQAEIARELGVGRSVINRQLMGTENMTMRRVAELAWAMGRDPDFVARKREVRAGANYHEEPAQKPNVQATNAVTGPTTVPSSAGARPTGGNAYVIKAAA